MGIEPKTIRVTVRFRPTSYDDEPPDLVVTRLKGSVKLTRSVTWLEVDDLEAGKLWLYPYDRIEEAIMEEV